MYASAEDMIAGNMAPAWVQYYQQIESNQTVYNSNYVFEIWNGTFTSNDPIAGSISWNKIKLKFNGVIHTITNDDTSDTYIYWEPTNPKVFSTSNTLPTVSIYLILIAWNDSGTVRSLWRSEDLQTRVLLGLNSDGIVANGKVVEDSLEASLATTISNASANAIQALQDAADSQSTADGKIVSYWQANPPATAGDGDLWFDTNDNNKVYRWTTDSWVLARDSGIAQAIENAATAQGTADGKSVVYYQESAPTGLGPEDVGDLWIDTDNNNKVYAWNSVAWILAQDWYAAYAAAETAGNIANQGWIQTCVFSSTDTDTVSWTSGTITTALGSSYSISAGNTGDMGAETYVYLDIAVSTTAYQVTTTPTDTVGVGKILVAVAEDNADGAVFAARNGINIKLSAADVLIAGTIVANLLAVDALNGKTIVGSTIKTATSGQRVEIDSTDGMQVYNSAGTVIAQFNGGVYANSIGHCTAHKNSVLGPELKFDYTLISGIGYFRFYIDGNQIMTLDQYGGLLLNPATSCIYIDGTRVIDSQQAAVADASGGATVDAEARTAINTLLARLRTHGLIAT